MCVGVQVREVLKGGSPRVPPGWAGLFPSPDAASPLGWCGPSEPVGTFSLAPASSYAKTLEKLPLQGFQLFPSYLADLLFI